MSEIICKKIIYAKRTGHDLSKYYYITITKHSNIMDVNYIEDGFRDISFYLSENL